MKYIQRVSVTKVYVQGKRFYPNLIRSEVRALLPLQPLLALLGERKQRNIRKLGVTTVKDKDVLKI